MPLLACVPKSLKQCNAENIFQHASCSLSFMLTMCSSTEVMYCLVLGCVLELVSVSGIDFYYTKDSGFVC